MTIRSRNLQPTTPQQINHAVTELAGRREKYASLSIENRVELIDSCIHGVGKIAKDWVAAACQAKGIPNGSPLQAEEILAGPIAALRYLKLIRQTLTEIARSGRPRLPATPFIGSDDRVHVPVVPVEGLFDSLMFAGFKATVRMQAGVTLENLPDNMASYYRKRERAPARIALVLGAGNVSSIAPADTFSKLFSDGHLVLLKMSPVNEYLGPLFEDAFHTLIDQGYLRIVYGGAETGSCAVHHPLVDTIHVTGSIDTHRRIVKGAAPVDSNDDQSTGSSPLDKPITSELGNVSPWIIVPGNYSQRQLSFQAENVAASVTNNASFNCVATKVVLTWSGWEQRTEFLDQLQKRLRQNPKRVAYYPGALERFRRFAPDSHVDCDDRRLPWTLLEDVQPDDAPRYFDEESFVCVFVEVQLDAKSPAAFLHQATDFANERLFGTLSAAITVPHSFRHASSELTLQSCLGQLKYGTVGINHWPGLAFAMMSPPWGGYPCSEVENVQSGLGWAHNTYMLDRPEKTILEGPLTVLPKPIWFASHRHADSAAWALLRLYQQPSWKRLPQVFLNASRG